MLKRFFLYGTLASALFIACKSKKEQTVVQNENWETPANITEGLSRGNKAPELSGKNPNDSVISLSSLRGYYVLIDFWASWCGPCRYENPNVVKAYKHFQSKKFKDGKGFKIFNVSLDNGKNPWVAAIKKDSLNWPYHISDLKGWNSEHGAKYQVSSIPTNWLIDPRGVIVAQGLRGAKLEQVLQQYVDTSTVPASQPKKAKKN